MKYLFTFFAFFLISCGGGSSAVTSPNPNPDSSTGVSGLSGSISNYEIIDVD